MEWKVIKTEKDYRKAINRLEVIFDDRKKTNRNLPNVIANVTRHIV